MTEERITDQGPPDYRESLPPVIQKNYGQWKYHEILKPGVLVHVAESGDKIFTVRIASPRLLSTESIRYFLSLADKYCGGYIRWTTRNNVEFLLDDEANIDPLIKELADEGWPAGGTGRTAMTARTHSPCRTGRKRSHRCGGKRSGSHSPGRLRWPHRRP